MNDCSVPADRSVDSGIKSFPAKFSKMLGKVTFESLVFELAAFCDLVAAKLSVNETVVYRQLDEPYSP